MDDREKLKDFVNWRSATLSLIKSLGESKEEQIALAEAVLCLDRKMFSIYPDKKDRLM